MSTMVIYALKERTRRRELYILAGAGLAVLLLLMPGDTSISINGASITGFSAMFPVIMTVVNAFGCLLALVLSVQTIPEEYRRKTSHLIWVRGISQARYHFALSASNFCAAAFAGLFLYLAVAGYLVAGGEAARLPALFPSYLLLCVNLATVAALTGALSVVLPPLATGLIGGAAVLAGVLSPVLRMASLLTDGPSATLLRILAQRTPNLDAIRAQMTSVVQGGGVDAHPVFAGLLWLYGAGLLFFLLRKKEA